MENLKESINCDIKYRLGDELNAGEWLCDTLLIKWLWYNMAQQGRNLFMTQMNFRIGSDVKREAEW